jgi:hypothetical protein
MTKETTQFERREPRARPAAPPPRMALILQIFRFDIPQPWPLLKKTT